MIKNREENKSDIEAINTIKTARRLTNMDQLEMTERIYTSLDDTTKPVNYKEFQQTRKLIDYVLKNYTEDEVEYQKATYLFHEGFFMLAKNFLGKGEVREAMIALNQIPNKILNSHSHLLHIKAHTIFHLHEIKAANHIDLVHGLHYIKNISPEYKEDHPNITALEIDLLKAAAYANYNTNKFLTTASYLEKLPQEVVDNDYNLLDLQGCNFLKLSKTKHLRKEKKQEYLNETRKCLLKIPKDLRDSDPEFLSLRAGYLYETFQFTKNIRALNAAYQCTQLISDDAKGVDSDTLERIKEEYLQLQERTPIRKHSHIRATVCVRARDVSTKPEVGETYLERIVRQIEERKLEPKREIGYHRQFLSKSRVEGSTAISAM